MADEPLQSPSTSTPDRSPASPVPARTNSLRATLLECFYSMSFRPIGGWAKVEAAGVKTGWRLFSIGACVVLFMGYKLGSSGKAALREQLNATNDSLNVANTRLAPFIAAGELYFTNAAKGQQLIELLSAATNRAPFQRIEDRIDELRMEWIADEQAELLERLFPGGFTLFTITESKQVIPYRNPPKSIFAIDWTAGWSGLELTRTEIQLTLPRIRISTEANNNLSFSSVVQLPRVVGSSTIILGERHGGGVVVGPHPDLYEYKWLLHAGVISTRKFGVVVVLGLSGPPPKIQNPR